MFALGPKHCLHWRARLPAALPVGGSFGMSGGVCNSATAWKVCCENVGWIAACYAAERVEDILSALAACPAAGARQAAADIAGKCPFSLKMTLRALRAARGFGRLEPCLELEYRLALACLARPDFREGVRAAVVDKDRHPRWSPDSLAGVTADMVDDAFAATDFGGLGIVTYKIRRN